MYEILQRSLSFNNVTNYRQINLCQNTYQPCLNQSPLWFNTISRSIIIMCNHAASGLRVYNGVLSFHERIATNKVVYKLSGWLSYIFIVGASSELFWLIANSMLFNIRLIVKLGNESNCSPQGKCITSVFAFICFPYLLLQKFANVESS
jgi:hypothetical protein